MKNFNGKDVYSLSYGIDVDPSKFVIYATNGHRLMIFNENSTKNDRHRCISFPITVSSVSAMNNLVAVGFSNGELKIFQNTRLNSVSFILKPN